MCAYKASQETCRTWRLLKEYCGKEDVLESARKVHMPVQREDSVYLGDRANSEHDHRCALAKKGDDPKVDRESFTKNLVVMDGDYRENLGVEESVHRA